MFLSSIGLPLMAGDTWGRERPALVYVDHRAGADRAKGTNAVRGLDETGPTETLQAALRRVNPSGLVVVLPVGHPIREEVVLDGRRTRGYPWQPLILEGNGLTWTGMPESPLPKSIVPPADISVLQAPITLAERLEEGVPYGSVVTGHGGAAYGGSAANGSIAGDYCSSWSSKFAGGLGSVGWLPGFGWNWRAAIRHPFAVDRELRAYVIATRRLRCALVIDRASYVVIRNIRFQGFSLDAVQVHGPANEVAFENCSFSGCGRAGLAALTNAHVELRNCLFEDNGKSAIINRNVSRLELAGCKLQAKPKAIDQDEWSRMTDVGGAFKPLESGPFMTPREFKARHAELTPPASSTNAPATDQPPTVPAKPGEKPKAKKSFFEE